MRKKPLRIAQLVLPWLSLPPRGYAGTERVVYWLTEELHKRGHDVTLFSVGSSKTKAKLAYLLKKPLGLQEDVARVLKSSFFPLVHTAFCFEQQKKFDIIHSHAQFLALPFAAQASTPSLHTFHRSLKEGLKRDEKEMLKYYRWLNFSSISNSQRALGLNFLATIYHGLPPDFFRCGFKKGKELLWVGRLIDKKGPKEAILAAKKLKMKLILIGKITEPDYFKKELAPQIDGQQIKYIGELSPEKLLKYYQTAYCLLFPIKWEEPFGLVAVEAQACGTPVVAFKRGAAKETIADKKTGFLVSQKKGVQGLVEAVENIKSIKRENCRQWVEKKFSLKKMVDQYEKLYERILETN